MKSASPENTPRSEPARIEPRVEAPVPIEDIPAPTGTLFVLMIYLAALAGMWGAMYLRLLGR